MKRMKWSEFIEKDEKVKLPEAFAKVLKVQEINPLELDVVQLTIEQVLAICKLFWKKEIASVKEREALKYFLEVIQEMGWAVIGNEILHTKELFDPNKHEGYINFFWVCFLTQESKDFKEKYYKNEDKLLTLLSQNRVNWGTQYALWHTLQDGKLSSLGTDTRDYIIEIISLLIEEKSPYFVKRILSKNKI